MIAHVLLNSLNKLRKGDNMQGLPSNLSLFRNEFHLGPQTVSYSISAQICRAYFLWLRLCIIYNFTFVL